MIIFLFCIILTHQSSVSDMLLAFASMATTLLFLTRLMCGSWEFLKSSYGVILLLPDLTPNLGLWWYFFIQMFDSFRNFFLVVFQLHLVLYVAPVMIKLRQSPLYAFIIITGLIGIFKSYPSVSDLGLFTSLLIVHRKVLAHMRYMFMTLSTLLFTTFLAPTFFHLWIYAGSGNANFFYAITLVYVLAHTILVTDSLYAMLRLQWEETEHPDLKSGSVIQVY